MTSTLLLRWGVFKIRNEMPEQVPEAPFGSRPEEPQWGQAGRRNLAWHKGKFGWKPQKVSLRVAELEPLFRVNPTEHLKSHWWQSIQAQVCLHPAKLHCLFLSPGMGQDLGNGPRMEQERHWTLGWELSSIAPVIPGQGCMGSVPVQLFLALSRAKSRKSKSFRFSFLPSFAFYQNKQLHSQRENSSSPQRVVWSLIFYSL